MKLKMLNVINEHFLCYDMSPLYKKNLYFCFFLSQREIFFFFEKKHIYTKKLSFNMERHLKKFLETHLKF